MITLIVYHPTKEFLAFLDENKFQYSVETISGYPNKAGKHDLGTIHVEDYPVGSYDGVIGLGCYWHSTLQEIKQQGEEMGLTAYQIKVAIERGVSSILGLRRIAKNIPAERI